jgi:hypothetical protein
MTDPSSTGGDDWRFDGLRALYVNCAGDNPEHR